MTIELNMFTAQLLYTDGTLTWIRLGSIHWGGSRHIRLIHRLKTEPKGIINIVNFLYFSEGHLRDKVRCIKCNLIDDVVSNIVIIKNTNIKHNPAG